MQVIDAVQSVATTVEKIKSNASQNWSQAASDLDSHRQGDIYITKIPRNMIPPDAIVDSSGSTRLDAPDNHEGHNLDSLDGVTVMRLANPGPCDGPILLLAQPRKIIHQRHGHLCDLPSGECFAVTYQQNWDALQKEARRVKD